MKGHWVQHERGAASIFVVTFFTLLIGVITLSFVNIVVQDQQQALNNDLSQSAYDAALAGTEDAHRALKWYGVECTPEKKAARTPAPPAVTTPEMTATNNDCAKFESGKQCNLQNISTTNLTTVLPGVKITGLGKETKISQTANSNDEKLDQAYTCVSLKTQTDDYKATLVENKSDTIIPLKVVNDIPVVSIDINWFMVGGGQANISPSDLSVPNQSESGLKPLRLANGSPENKGQQWGRGTPPILRVQIIPAERGSIDVNNLSLQTRTLFLYPSSRDTAPTSIDVQSNTADPGRSMTKNAPSVIKCAGRDQGQYACSVTLTSLLRGNPDPSSTSATDYFLRITPIYNNANLKIVLKGPAGEALLFDNVAPEIDSTGRANDVYRRVQTRVQTIMGANPTSDGGFDITQGLCKDFQVPAYSTECPANLMPN